MGVTGVGKSTFIRSLTDSSSRQIALGKDFAQVPPYTILSHRWGSRIDPGRSGLSSQLEANHWGRVWLIDTPGFDDEATNDGDLLETLVGWLRQTYTAGQELAGIMYLMPVELAGSAVKNARMFRDLVGSNCYRNTRLVTTCWDMDDLSDRYGTGAREKELVSRQCVSRQNTEHMMEKGLAQELAQESTRPYWNRHWVRMVDIHDESSRAAQVLEGAM